MASNLQPPEFSGVFYRVQRYPTTAQSVNKFANRDYVLYNNYCGGGFATAGLTTPSNALCIRKVKNTPTRGWGTVNILNKQCYTFDSSQPPTTRIFPVVLFMKKTETP